MTRMLASVVDGTELDLAIDGRGIALQPDAFHGPSSLAPIILGPAPE